MPPPAARASARTWPLVGRDGELSALSAAMDDAGCGGVALAGAAGVGKTRLAREVAELALLRGLVTVAVRASKSAADVPLMALSPLFAELAIEPATTESPGWAAAAAIARLTGSGRRGGGQAGSGRAGNKRLVLLVDDVQELDDASMSVLGHLVEDGGTFVVMTVRHGETLPRGLHDLLTDERIVRIEVEPLDASMVRALVGAVLGGPVDGAALQALARQSSGNVLFLRELLQGALESGALASHRGIWRLKGSLAASPWLRDLIDERLRGLSRKEREALELVALGEPLELGVLVTLASVEVVESLEQKGLLDASAGRSGPDVRLAHPLYGEVVRAHLSALRRARLCRSLADMTEAAGPLRARDVLRVAVWRLDGGGGNAEVMLQAAKMAYRDEDYALAIRLAESAWEDGGLVEAAILLAEAIDVHGRSADVERVLRAALPLAGNDVDRTAIANGLASAVFYSPDRAEEADRLLLETSAAVTDPASRRSLQAQRAGHFLRTGHVARTIEIDSPLLELEGDAAFMQASRDVGVALALAGRTAEAIGHTEAALAARRHLEEVDRASAAAVYLVARAVALAEAGRLSEAIATAEAGYSASVVRGNPHGQAWFAVILASTRATQGRLAMADHLFREAATLYEARGHPGARWGFGGIALTAGQLGDRAGATAAVAELDLLAPTTLRLMDIHVERGRAWAALAAGDLAAARAILWAAVELAAGWGQHASMSAALHDLVRLGDSQAAARRLEGLAGVVDGDLMVARLRLARAVRTGDPALAEGAADGFEACGALLYAAEAASIEQRLAIDARLHRRATAAAARSQRLARKCEGARTPALAAPGAQSDLSAREHEVALLAADGLTSRQIAERLFLSARTVDNHLQRIYLKLGISGRSGLPERLTAAPNR
jgi:DNA-binding CsgD family transcriptional regulator